MNKKNKLIFIFVLFMAIGAVLGIVCHNKLNKSQYALNLPVSEDLYSIVLNKNENEKEIEIKDNEKIKDIVNVLNGVKRTTSKQSIQDSPVNVENEIKVDFNFKEEGTSTVFVYEKNDKYYVEQPYNGIYRISPDEYNSIEKYFRDSEGNNTSSYVPNGMDVADEKDNGTPANTQNFNRSPENVTIEVLKDTISNKGVTIRITDNNEDTYGWGVEFRVQEKVNGEWKDLEYLSNNLYWIEIAYELGEDKQLDLKLDIEEYYGELPSGTYRIVKPVYDKEYIDIYSNEFEIK